MLLRSANLQDPTVQLALMQLCRRTGDRFRDIGEKLRKQCVERLTAANAREHLIQLIDVGGNLAEEEASMIIGESLPAGLRLK